MVRTTILNIAIASAAITRRTRLSEDVDLYRLSRADGSPLLSPTASAALLAAADEAGFEVAEGREDRGFLEGEEISFLMDERTYPAPGEFDEGVDDLDDDEEDDDDDLDELDDDVSRDAASSDAGDKAQGRKRGAGRAVPRTAARRLLKNAGVLFEGTHEFRPKNFDNYYDVTSCGPACQREVAAVEDAVAEATGMPLSRTEPPLFVARADGTLVDPEAAQSLFCNGDAHLDSHLSPARRWAMVARAHTAHDDAADSRVAAPATLVFPCVETDDMEPSEAAVRAKMCTAAHGHALAVRRRLEAVKADGDSMSSGHREFFEQNPALALLTDLWSDHPNKTSFAWTKHMEQVFSEAAKERLRERAGKQRAQSAEASARSLGELTRKLCAGETEGMRVSLLPGEAVLYRVATKRGTVEKQMWHARCPEGQGGSNMVVKFKDADL